MNRPTLKQAVAEVCGSTHEQKFDKLSRSDTLYLVTAWIREAPSDLGECLYALSAATELSPLADEIVHQAERMARDDNLTCYIEIGILFVRAMIDNAAPAVQSAMDQWHADYAAENFHTGAR
jgi:hypothetical protein